MGAWGLKRLLAGSAGGFEGVAPLFGGGFHDAEEAGPIDLVDAAKGALTGIVEAGAVAGDDEGAFGVEATATGAAIHLQEFVGAEFALDRTVLVAGAGDGDGADGEIDASGEAGGGDDEVEVAVLGEGFDPVGAGGVGEAAVVEGGAAGEEAGEVLAEEGLSLGGMGMASCRGRASLRWRAIFSASARRGAKMSSGVRWAR